MADVLIAASGGDYASLQAFEDALSNPTAVQNVTVEGGASFDAGIVLFDFPDSSAITINITSASGHAVSDQSGFPNHRAAAATAARSDGSGVGGIEVKAAHTLVITDFVMSRLLATGSSCDVTLKNCVIRQAATLSGRTVTTALGTNQTIRLYQCHVFGPFASNTEAIRTNAGGSTITMLNCTVVGNTGTAAVCINTSGTFTCSDSIVLQNGGSGACFSGTITGNRNVSSDTAAPNTATAWATATSYAFLDVRQHGGEAYICRVAHTSDSTTEPGVGASWEDKWDKLTSRTWQSVIRNGNQYEEDLHLINDDFPRAWAEDLIWGWGAEGNNTSGLTANTAGGVVVAAPTGMLGSYAFRVTVENSGDAYYDHGASFGDDIRIGMLFHVPAGFTIGDGDNYQQMRFSQAGGTTEYQVFHLRNNGGQYQLGSVGPSSGFNWVNYTRGTTVFLLWRIKNGASGNHTWSVDGSEVFNESADLTGVTIGRLYLWRNSGVDVGTSGNAYIDHVQVTPTAHIEPPYGDSLGPATDRLLGADNLATIGSTDADGNTRTSLRSFIGADQISAGATFTGSGAATTGGTAAAATATFAPGTKTASIASISGGAAGAATASHTPPTFTASVVSTAGGAAGAATATFAPPNRTASMASTAGGVEAAASATHTAPVFTAEVASTSGGAAAAATAQFAASIHTASVAGATGGAASEATATFVAPVFTASVASAVGGAGAAATATFTPPTFTGSVAATAGGAAGAATAAFSPGTKTASVVATVGGVAAAATVAVANPQPFSPSGKTSFREGYRTVAREGYRTRVREG